MYDFLSGVKVTNETKFIALDNPRELRQVTAECPDTFPQCSVQGAAGDRPLHALRAGGLRVAHVRRAQQHQVPRYNIYTISTQYLRYLR